MSQESTEKVTQVAKLVSETQNVLGQKPWEGHTDEVLKKSYLEEEKIEQLVKDRFDEFIKGTTETVMKHKDELKKLNNKYNSISKGSIMQDLSETVKD